MDLIYANIQKEDIGILKDYSFDLAYGEDENDFELTCDISNNVCGEDYLIYIENTEYGGFIDSIEVDTEQKEIKYKGRTFHGILDKKIIIPDANQDYLIVNGDANVIIDNLINKVGLNSLFSASTDVSVNISNYKFSRYTTLYKGILDMLASVNYKLMLTYQSGNVVLSAVPLTSYDDDTLNSDKVSFQIQKTYNLVNHLICLGKGELKNRTVIHLYLDNNGTVSNTQYYYGIEEITEVFDYPNVESADELRKEGIKKLLEYNTTDVQVTLDNEYVFDVGDIITATDVITGVTVTRKIIKKIVTINNDLLQINYKVGE